MQETILTRLHDNARNMATAPAYYVKQNGSWQMTNWGDYLAQVRQTARSLIALGFEPGNKVCILGFNRPEWVLFDVAAMLAGGAPAGIYTTNSPDETAYIINHSEAQIVLVEDEGQWDKIAQKKAELPMLKHVVLMKGATVPDDPIALSWEAFLAKADETPEERLNESMANLEPDQVATMIYTSGTTGPPKAVMLSHNNLLWTAKTVGIDMFGINSSDSALSYLPLSHIAEQMFTIHAAICTGYSVYFAESPLLVADNLKEVQPTVVFGVPRVWERFYNGVSDKLKELSGPRAKLVHWAMGVGKQVNALKMKGQEPGGMLAGKYKLANKLVFAKFKPLLGLGRARICVSGAAPIAPEILDFFTGLDIVIYEVYGQSEGSGPSTFNIPGKTAFGTVGLPLPGTEVVIAEDGEVLVKGPNVFLGYFKDPQATNSTLIDGWLHSGDLGQFDEQGVLTITGRKKDIIITSGGKNIAPKNIEAALTNIDLVAQAIVIGEGRRFLTALLTLEELALERFAKENNLSPDNLHENPQVVAAIQAGVDEVNTHFARVEHVRKFTILPRNFTVEDGEMTPTLKLKRNVVQQAYTNQIEAMYAE